MVNTSEYVTSNFYPLKFFAYLNCYSLINPEQNPYSMIKYLNHLFHFLSEIIYDPILVKMWGIIRRNIAQVLIELSFPKALFNLLYNI